MAGGAALNGRRSVMAQRAGVPRLLFRLACGAAALLVAAVLAAPWLDAGGRAGGVSPLLPGWRRLVALFARDAALRRTSLASAAGLLVTACVFFRPPQPPPDPAPAPTPRRRPPDGGAGA
jgi:hypothetical protein